MEDACRSLLPVAFTYALRSPCHGTTAQDAAHLSMDSGSDSDHLSGPVVRSPMPQRMPGQWTKHKRPLDTDASYHDSIHEKFAPLTRASHNGKIHYESRKVVNS